MFRLLGLHPGPDIASPRPPAWPQPRWPGAGPAIRADPRHLLTEHAPGRYAFHVLLRAYAGELTRAHDDLRSKQRRPVHRPTTCPPPGPRTGSDRAIPLPITIGQLPGGITAVKPTTAEEEMTWFATEQPTLP